MPVVTLLVSAQSTAANVISSGGSMPNKMLPLMGVGLWPTMLHLLLPVMASSHWERGPVLG